MKLTELFHKNASGFTHYTKSANSDKVIAFKYGVCDFCGSDANEGAVTMSQSDAKALGLEESDELPPDLNVDEEGNMVCQHCTEKENHIDDEREFR